MDDLARAEYPAIVASLPPGQAVQVLNDRVKRINKINVEIADWLQERRRVEEQYVQGLRKLSQTKLPNAQSELGVFLGPWNRITEAIDHIAISHHRFAERVERDVEAPLRSFQQRKDAQNMHSISQNLAAIAKDLDKAQEESDKLSKRGARASSQKVDAAASRLESATQQWQSQAPFIFETLQALDESRVNQLRDLLTQYQTHESDQAQQIQEHAAATIAIMLEISTETEVQSFVRRVTAGREKLPPRTPTRQLSTGTSSTTAPPPPLPSQPSQPSTTSAPGTPPAPTSVRDDASEHNSIPTEKPEQKQAGRASRLGRIGTVFNRRRQSMHAGFGQLSSFAPQQKTPSNPLNSGFTRTNSRGVSPRPSTGNLNEASQLSSLAETSPPPRTEGDEPARSGSHEETNGVRDAPPQMGALAPSSDATGTTNGVRGSDDSQWPAAPAPKQMQGPAVPTKDAEGYTLPAAADDPISRAQREAAAEGAVGEDGDQGFKVSIQNTPVEEEDPQAKQAAMSNVANTLRMGPATRRTGTVRGRRDVRNTMYVPSPTVSDSSPAFPALSQFSTFSSTMTIPGSPPSTQQSLTPKLPPVAALAAEGSTATASDKESIRSTTSFGSLAAHVKHPEMTGPGLNASIIETVSAVFENGAAKSVAIAGEVAFANNASEADNSRTHETIRINKFPSLERIGPNRIFVQNASPDQPDQFSLDLSQLTKPSTAFSYKVFSTDDASLAHAAPLLVRPAWKPLGDKLGLLLQYSLNPAAAERFPVPVTLHNVAFVVTYGGRAASAQTKPSGTHVRERQLVYWRLGDVTLTSDVQKIVCRVIGADGTEPTPGTVHAKWEYVSASPSEAEAAGSAISISRLEQDKGKGKQLLHEDDPFADSDAPTHEASWVEVPLVRKLVAGDYEGKAT